MKIKGEIISLLMAGNNHDLSKIIENKLSPMLKGKILSTYFPQIFVYSSFLYTKLTPINEKNLPDELNKFIGDNYPSLDKVNAQYINLELRKPVINNNKSSNKNKGQSKKDFNEQNRSKKKLGTREEKIVFIKEKQFLTNIGKKDLAEKVEYVAKNNDGAGYDILSYDTNGKKKYNEVKSTK